MSLHLEFEPHSWYMGFAIKDDRAEFAGDTWAAYTDDGMTYSIVTLTAETLADLKLNIREYHRRDNGKHMPWRLERYLKGTIG